MKVFISFLGAIRYEETTYYFDKKEDASSPTYYVQEAILNKQLLESWGPDDKIYIFTTDDAYQNNFIKRIVKYDSVSQKSDFSPLNDGLESVLQHYFDSGKIGHFEAVRIENGNSVAEIWQVFQTVYDKLKDVPDGSDIFFDITFGFRSLPMLGIVLLNYVKTLHNHNIRFIYYGNYEVGRQEKLSQISEATQNKSSDEAIALLKSAIPCSPVLDLRPFVELQDWTTASRAFLKGGNAELLSDIMPESQKELGNDLQHFTQSILTCRGSDLLKIQDIERLKNDISNLNQQTNIEVQLSPLLQKIEDKIQNFSSQTTLNGFAAVDWCIQNGLIQQGYTFLEETCKSFLIERTAGLPRLDDPTAREAAKVVLNNITRHRWSERDRNGNIVLDVQLADNMKLFVQEHCSHLSYLYKRMTGQGGLRNDINHCGHSDNPKTPSELKNDLQSLYNDIFTTLNIVF